MTVVEVERRIAAPPEIVFSYFTDPDRYRIWQGVDADLDPRPGGLFRVRMTGRSRHIATGEYVEVDPPTRIVFTWGWEPDPSLLDEQVDVAPGTSTVEVTLVPDGDATILRLRHSGLPTERTCIFHNWGWDSTIERLLVAVAGGDPGPGPFPDI
ncbi:MAG: SRPBCC domain-containing protein [Acidimicrobiia bacterium]|nr:SRPBCC domain-containing protein [Acidimicrobiia bacterium]